MDIQHALLSKVILGADITPVVSARITPDFFTDDTYRRVYEYLLRHFNEYGSSPDAEVVGRAFPNATWEPSSQPLDYFIDQMRARRKRTILVDALSDASQYVRADDDPDALDKMEHAIHDGLIRARLETATSYDVNFMDSSAVIDQLLTERAANPGYLRGISTGFDGIDYVTGGLQPEQLITLIGTPKSFKSATELYMAWAAHRQAKTPLFIGFEMSNVEQGDRLLSLLSGVSLNEIMHGTYSPKQQAKIVRAVRIREEMQPFVLSSDITSATTVSGVQAKIQEYHPDVVFIDGAYLMDPSGNFDRGSPQALTDITRSLKRLAQQQRIPIVITTQALLARSKTGLTLSSIGYSSSFAQDSDVILGVERTDRENEPDLKAAALVKFHVIASRSGPRREVFLEWDWHHGKVTEVNPNRVVHVDHSYDDDEDE